jgi:acyl-CoA synthetase (AMP-forming)/AMP-acid ligase II
MLIDLVRASAARAPDHPAVVAATGSTTYGTLLRNAELVATALHRDGVERFGYRVDDPALAVAVLVAASAAGAEPCVYPASADGTATAALAERLGHDRVLDGDDVARWLGAEPAGLAPAPAPATRGPLLVLTTGTTGQPKAARHDWGRLLAGVRHRAPSPDHRWLLAYNLNQFAGIQVLLHVLASGATVVVPPSIQPRAAVETMVQHGVTHASATPTFWRYVVGALDARVAAAIPLRQITLGGEAVPGPLLDRLATLFPGARISQIYASTEFGSGVSVTDGRSGLPLSVLDRTPDQDVQYRIVDGQLEARSNVGMLGYLGTDDRGDNWRPTGDLVQVIDDRIVFAGRLGDVINVGGVKVHPLPIEEAVAAVPGVAMARAYGRPNPVSGHIVAVDVVPQAGMDVEVVEDAIRAACSRLPLAARPRRIRFVDDIEIRGGKLVRQEVEPDAG